MKPRAPYRRQTSEAGNRRDIEHDALRGPERAGLTRRDLLARAGGATLVVAGVGGFAGLAGCGGSRRASYLRQLAREVSGPVLLPGENGYAPAKLLFNPAFDKARPRAIVLCHTPEDVAATIRFARRHGFPLAAKSGGHSFGGYSAPDGGIVADVSRMNHIRIASDRRSALLGPGVLNIDMYAGLGGSGLALPSGDCPTVGLGGLTLGGGFGYSSRKLGLTADNLIELELVLASGKRIVCSHSQNPDLFWACRGGGGGNFGIATSFRYRVHPVRGVSIYELDWRWEEAAAVVDAWQRLAPGAPDELFSTCSLSRAGGYPLGEPAIHSQGQYFGPPDRLAALLAPLLAAAKPVRRVIAAHSFLAAQERFAGCVPGECALHAANAHAVKTAFVTDPLPAAGIRTALEELERWPGSAATAPPAVIELNPWGGAIGRVSPSATAFVHRDARVLAIYRTTWSPLDSAASVAANRRWLERLYRVMRPYTSGYAYQNLIDPQLPDWAHAYYGSNLARLVEVKRHYDPDDVFHFAQSIPVAL